MNKAGERLYNGLIKENPTFVLMLGMCPTLAVTTSAMNGLGMGLTTMVVLALSNMMISALRKIIPNSVRIPAFIVIIASFVTIVQLFLQAYLDSLNDALGVYIPLIVVNCIILGRAESYAYFNPPIPSLFDGIGMGLGFTLGLTSIGMVREILGAGELFGFAIMPAGFEPIRILGQAPGAFFVLACLVAAQNYMKIRGERKGRDVSKIGSGCSEDCMNCGQEGCAKRFYDNTGKQQETEPAIPEPKATEVEATEVKTPEPKATEVEVAESETEIVKTEKAKTAKPKTTKSAKAKKTESAPAETASEIEFEDLDAEKTEAVAEKTEAVAEKTEAVVEKETASATGTKSNSRKSSGSKSGTKSNGAKSSSTKSGNSKSGSSKSADAKASGTQSRKSQKGKAQTDNENNNAEKKEEK